MRGKINEIGPRRSLRAGARRRLSRAINRAVESHASGYFSVTVGVCTFSIFSLRSSSCARVHSGGDADLRHPWGGRFSQCNPRKFQARRALRKMSSSSSSASKGRKLIKYNLGILADIFVLQSSARATFVSIIARLGGYGRLGRHTGASRQSMWH